MTHFKAGDEPINFANGMELRDYFASHAMQGMIANNHWFGDTAWNTEQEMVNQYTQEAYNFADAMMKAREKE